MERRQTMPGSWGSFRIEMVGTRLGSVAVGIFGRMPNDRLRTMHVVVVDHDAGELTAQLTAVNLGPSSPKAIYNPPSTVKAFIDEARIFGAGGLEEPWPYVEERRKERALLGTVARQLAESGSAYDPFQSEEVRPYLFKALDSQPLIHPAVAAAAESLRS